MKKYISLAIVSVFAVALFNSCRKDVSHRLLTKPLAYTSYIKVVHAAPGFRKVFNAQDSFSVIIGGINGLRLYGGIFSYFIPPTVPPAPPPTNIFAFPSNTLNTDTYAAVPSGSQDIRLVLRGIVNIDSITVATIPKNLDPGNFYTLVITDSITTTGDFSKIWTQDVFPTPAAGTYQIRFIHAVMDDTAGKKVDVYSTKQAATMFTNVSPGTVTGFISLPYATGDTVIVRRAGTTFELDRFPRNATQQPAPVAYANSQRVYTILYRGNAASTAGSKGRSIFVYNNR